MFQLWMIVAFFLKRYYQIAELCSVLERAWKLGLMSAEDYPLAMVTPLTFPLASRFERLAGQRLLEGRALSIGEIQAL